MKILLGGAGGFAREAVFYIQSSYPEAEISLFDDFTEAMTISSNYRQYPVIKSIDDLRKSEFDGFFVAVGDPQLKVSIVEKVTGAGVKPLPSYVHDSVIRSGCSKFGVGGIICPSSVITVNAVLGDWVLVNLGVTVGHDAIVGDYCTINPNASISGNAHVGEGTLVGSGAVVLEGKSIGSWNKIGAGAVVSKSFIESHSTLVGVPAKRL